MLKIITFTTHTCLQGMDATKARPDCPRPPPWPSVAACLKDLLGGTGEGQGEGIRDHGSHRCRDAYAYLYNAVEAVAHEEETPEDLQCLIPSQGPSVVGHITRGLLPAVHSPIDFTDQVAAALPLLTVLLNDKRCCAQLAKNNHADERVLGVLLDILEGAQQQLITKENQGAYHVHLIALADISFTAFDTLAHQACDMSHLSEEVLLKILTVLRLGVAGGFGKWAALVPARSLQTSIKLLPRLAPNARVAGHVRGLLKAILLRVLKGGNRTSSPTTEALNTEEIGMAVTALAQARSTAPQALLVRDPVSGPPPSDATYCSFVRSNFDEKRLEWLQRHDLPLAVRVVESMLPLLGPAGLSDGRVMRKVLEILNQAIRGPGNHGAGLCAESELQQGHVVRRAALEIWTSSYVLSVARDWDMIVRRVQRYKSGKEAFLRQLLRVLCKPLVHYFASAPSGNAYQGEQDSRASRLMLAILSKKEWQVYLWGALKWGRTEEALQSVGSRRDVSVRGVLLNMLATRHNDHGNDPARHRFEDGLRCLSFLVPGALPESLLPQGSWTMPDRQQIPPLEGETQLHLLILAIRVLAQHESISKHYLTFSNLHQDEKGRSIESGRPPSQGPASLSLFSSPSPSPGSEEAAGSIAGPPPLPEGAIKAAWGHMLRRLLPAFVPGALPTLLSASLPSANNNRVERRIPQEISVAVAGNWVDEVFEMLLPQSTPEENGVGKGLPLSLCHTLVDEALELYGASDLLVQTRLWSTVLACAYDPAHPPVPVPPTVLGPSCEAAGAVGDSQAGKAASCGHHATSPVTLGFVLIGLKALLFRPLPWNNPHISSLPPSPLPQLILFLAGALRRLTSSERKSQAGDPRSPRPFLHLYRLALLRLVSEVGTVGKRGPAAETTLRQACMVLTMLSHFAASPFAHVVFQDAWIPGQGMGGGILVQHWQNLLSTCLQKCRGGFVEAGEQEEDLEDRESLSILLEEDPVRQLQAVLAVLDPVLGPKGRDLRPHDADGTSGASGWDANRPPKQNYLAHMVLAHVYLRAVNTFVQASRRGEGMHQRERRRTLLDTYVSAASGRLLKMVEDITSSRYEPSLLRTCLCGSPSCERAVAYRGREVRSGARAGGKTWLSPCLAPPPVSWELASLAGICGSLAKWWSLPTRTESGFVKVAEAHAPSSVAAQAEDNPGVAAVSKRGVLANKEGVSILENHPICIHPCRAHLVGDVSRMVDRVLTSLGGCSRGACDISRRSFMSSAEPGPPTLLKAPAPYLRALQPLLTALLTRENGDERLSMWWRMLGLSAVENLGIPLDGREYQDVRSLLKICLSRGIISSQDKALTTSLAPGNSRMVNRSAGDQEQLFWIESRDDGLRNVKKRWSGIQSAEKVVQEGKSILNSKTKRSKVA